MDKMKLSKPTRYTRCTMKIFTKVCCLCVYIQPMNVNCWRNSCGIALTQGTELETVMDCLILVKYVKYISPFTFPLK